MTRIVVGVAWYSRDTWARLRELAPDGSELEATYEDWLAVYYDGVAKIRQAGVNPQRVVLCLNSVAVFL